MPSRMSHLGCLCEVASRIVGLHVARKPRSIAVVSRFVCRLMHRHARVSRALCASHRDARIISVCRAACCDRRICALRPKDLLVLLLLACTLRRRGQEYTGDEKVCSDAHVAKDKSDCGGKRCFATPSGHFPHFWTEGGPICSKVCHGTVSGPTVDVVPCDAQSYTISLAHTCMLAASGPFWNANSYFSRKYSSSRRLSRGNSRIYPPAHETS